MANGMSPLGLVLVTTFMPAAV